MEHWIIFFIVGNAKSEKYSDLLKHEVSRFSCCCVEGQHSHRVVVLGQTRLFCCCDPSVLLTMSFEQQIQAGLDTHSGVSSRVPQLGIEDSVCHFCGWQWQSSKRSWKEECTCSKARTKHCSERTSPRPQKSWGEWQCHSCKAWSSNTRNQCFGCGVNKDGQQLVREHETAQPETGSNMKALKKTSAALNRQLRGSKRTAPRGRDERWHKVSLSSFRRMVSCL